VQFELLEKTFPTTRYQGSKLRFANWIWSEIKNLKFHSVLDAFGGTASIAYKLKKQGKKVTYNDILKFNWYIGKALIENDKTILTNEDVDAILSKKPRVKYPTFIQDSFIDTYYTNEENIWLDMVVYNISKIKNEYKKAIAYFALFQSCLAKRPYNLFHRKNLYIRLSDVDRSFGNKVTWDKPFVKHFCKFVEEANNAVFSNGEANKSLNHDAMELDLDYDLVYVDTPYISDDGGGTDYLEFYHFLEGLVNYNNWYELIDHNSKHKKMQKRDNPWCDNTRIEKSFNDLFNKFKSSIIVVSYRSDGYPAIEVLENILKKYKNNVKTSIYSSHKYALSKRTSQEVIIIGY